MCNMCLYPLQYCRKERETDELETYLWLLPGFIVARQFKMFRIFIIQRSDQMHYKGDAYVDGTVYGDNAE